MPAKSYPRDVLDQARAALEAWKQFENEMQLATLSPADLEADMNQMAEITSEMNRLEARFTDLRNKRDDMQRSIWDKVKRVRAGAKANFGDDSSQYEMVGGTRLSERKHPSKRKSEKQPPQP